MTGGIEFATSTAPVFPSRIWWQTRHHQLSRARMVTPGWQMVPTANYRCQLAAIMEIRFMTMEDLKGIVQSDPEIMGGTPVFVGTRVPLQNLIDALEGGDSIDDFLEGFPTVTRLQAIAVIEAGQLKMLETVGYAHSH
jgi:uncharacterized protein (DUF433 family)